MVVSTTYLFAIVLVATLAVAFSFGSNQLSPQFTSTGGTCGGEVTATDTKCVGDAVVTSSGDDKVIQDKMRDTGTKESCAFAGSYALDAADAKCVAKSTPKAACEAGICKETQNTGQVSKDGKLCCTVTVSCPCVGKSTLSIDTANTQQEFV